MLSLLAQQQPDTAQVGWIVALGAAGTVIGALVGLGTIGRWMLRALDRRISAQTAGLQRVEQAVATSNGHSTGELVETMAGQLVEVRDEIGILTERSTENRDTAHRAEIRAEQAAQDAARALGAIGQIRELLVALVAGRGKEE